MGGELVEFLTQNEDSFRRNRLPALYSDFRSLRDTNPDGYAANVSAWRRALASIARSGLASSPAHTLTLTTDENLLRALESKQYGRPPALGTVIQEAVAAHDLIPLPDFLTSKQSVYNRSLSWSSLPWAVLSWGLKQAGLTGGATDKLPRARFVVLANVEAAAKAFAERTSGATSRFERTWSRAHFVKSFADALFPTQTLSGTDLDVLLTFLSRDKGIIVYDGSVVKIAENPSAMTTTTSPQQKEAAAAAAIITMEDVAIAQLRELTAYLTHQTTVLNKRIEELAAAAKEAVTKKNRVSALAALRSKKQAEASLQARFASLSQLQEVASRIEQAADQVQLMKVMASSADALRSLNAQVGGAEQVADVVDRLREQMGAVDEVGSILAEAAEGGATAALDEGEIDDELAAMEREETEKAEAAERARKEAAEIREAEATRRRLEGVEAPTTTPVALAVAEDARLEKEAVEDLRRLSLQEQPLAQTAT